MNFTSLFLRKLVFPQILSWMISFIIFNIINFGICYGESFLEYKNVENLPIIINTWAFDEANQAGWLILKENGSALDAIVAAGSKCESLQCDHTVGWGGSPDENGETTLDAMIMDGPSHKIGSVGALRQIKDVIQVARAILDHSTHTMLVGSQATDFAIKMGFKQSNLTSEWSEKQFQEWKSLKCQPNYWLNVHPDPQTTCGPYKPNDMEKISENPYRYNWIDETNHDTIGAVAIDSQGRMACGTSTNGMKHKIPGRVGDSPIPGAGSYVDQDIGGAAATGDGDIILRFLPSYQAVENLRNGMDPMKAAQQALSRILKKYPEAQVGIVVLDNQGNYGAACINIPGGFPFVVRTSDIQRKTDNRVQCMDEIPSGNYSTENVQDFLLFLILITTTIIPLFV